MMTISRPLTKGNQKIQNVYIADREVFVVLDAPVKMGSGFRITGVRITDWQGVRLRHAGAVLSRNSVYILYIPNGPPQRRTEQ